jgi:hypothetical protein
MFLHIISQEWQDFRKKKIIEHGMSVLNFYTLLSETFLILRRNEQDTGVLISPYPDQEGNGSPGTCNPEETGLPGLPMS